jgi:hypothetical protein
MVAHPQGIRHNRQRRVNACIGWKETAIDDIEILDIVGTAIEVED